VDLGYLGRAGGSQIGSIWAYLGRAGGSQIGRSWHRLGGGGFGSPQTSPGWALWVDTQVWASPQKIFVNLRRIFVVFEGILETSPQADSAPPSLEALWGSVWVDSQPIRDSQDSSIPSLPQVGGLARFGSVPGRFLVGSWSIWATWGRDLATWEARKQPFL